MDLADELACRRIAPHAVFRGIAVSHGAPDIAIEVGPHPVAAARTHVRDENLVIDELLAIDVENPDIRSAPFCGHDSRIDDIKLLLVGGERDPVRSAEAAG